MRTIINIIIIVIIITIIIIIVNMIAWGHLIFGSISISHFILE